MPLFDRAVTPRLLWPLNAPWPKKRARNLIKRFQECFPELSYDMDLEVKLANAQAFIREGRKHVRLYGGLVRHRRIGFAGLALVLAHETGHHLGGPPYLPFYRWLSSEERATEWAVTVGLQRVFGDKRAVKLQQAGLSELISLGLGGS